MYAGIDIGGTYIKGILIDRSGKELSFKEIETKKNADEIVSSIDKLIETLSTSASVSKIDIKSIGVGCPGPIDKEKGTILKAPNIPSFNNYQLVQNLEDLTGKKAVLENDATVALVGTWWLETGNKYRNWVLVTLGTGIGGGLIVDNKIYTGKSGNSMEVGHMTIDFNGKECPCGNKGCWERYASGPAMVELAHAYLKKQKGSSVALKIKQEELTPLLIYQEALNKDELALSVMEEYSTYVGIGLVNIINMINPEAIFIGGGVSKAHKFILPIVKKTISERAIIGFKENIQIFPVKEPNKIPSFGAAKVAMNAFNA